MREHLKLLVESFNDEQGLPENAFIATYALISLEMGVKAASKFNNCVDAIDGYFYTDCASAGQIWELMERAEKE